VILADRTYLLDSPLKPPCPLQFVKTATALTIPAEDNLGGFTLINTAQKIYIQATRKIPAPVGCEETVGGYYATRLNRIFLIKQQPLQKPLEFSEIGSCPTSSARCH
jgi:hypothetical protein